MNKTFEYKSYAPRTDTLYNRIWRGDFNGDYPYQNVSNWLAYWSTGSQTSAYRDRRQTGYQAFVAGKGLKNTSAMTITSATPAKYAGMFLVSKADWTLLSDVNDILGWYDPVAKTGVGIAINYTSGYISALAGNGTTLYEAKVLLSTLASGTHALGIKADGTNLKLYVDGVAVATTAAAITVSYPGPFPQFGANLYNVGITGVFQGNIYHCVMYTEGTLGHLPADANFATYADGYSAWQKNTIDTATYIFDFSDVVVGSTFTVDRVSNQFAYVNVIGGITADLIVDSPINQAGGIKIITSTSGASGQGLTNSQTIPVTLGQKYTFSYWVKGTAAETVTAVVSDFTNNYSITTTMTGAWQRVNLTFTALLTATVYVNVYMNNAAASAKTFYLDGFMFEDGAILHDYFDGQSISDVGVSYYSDSSNLLHYAVVQDYTFKGTLTNDVSSDFNLEQEINTAGSQVEIELALPADDFGERDTIDFNNRVVVSVVDDNYPNGLTKFVGKIENYEPAYDTEKVTVTLLGYGADLDKTIFEGAAAKLIYQEDSSGVRKSWGNLNFDSYQIGQKFITGPTQTKIESIEILMDATSASQYITLCLWDNYAQAKYHFPTGAQTYNPIVQPIRQQITNTTAAWIKFNFIDTTGNPAPVDVLPNTPYYITMVTDAPAGVSDPNPVGVSTSDTDPYSGGFLFRGSDSALKTVTEYPLTDMCFRINTSYGSTRVPKLSKDPSQMLKDILDDQIRQGGAIGYDDTTIEMTETEVSYTFNANTIWESAAKCLELAPENWYAYIDQATNMYHFHPKSSATTHTLILGKHIKNASFAKRQEPIVNDLLITGGDDPSNPGTNLFKRYVDQASIDLYGKRLFRISDSRVTLESTMDTMANAILSTRSDPEIRTPIEIFHNIYNTELIKPGDLFRFRGFINEGTSSNWDVGDWADDTDDPGELWWDYDITNPDTLELQIARYSYMADLLSTTLSTTPPDVNKRIEDINRNLQTTQQESNPDAPISEE